MEKIRVIHIWKDLDTFYGVHDQLLSLARYINKDLFDISICVFNYKGHSLGSEFEKLDVPVYNLKMDRAKNPLIIFKLVKFLKEKKPHIIQTYVLNTNIYGRISGKLAGVPIIIPTELTLKDQVSSKLKRARDHLLYPLNRFLNYFSDCIVFVSDAVKKEWVGRRISKKYRIIYAPFNYEKLKCYEKPGNKTSGDNKDFVIGIVARLSKEKGHIYIFDAMPEIIKVFPGVKLLIIGTGPEEKELKQYVYKKDLSGYVTFTGHKKNVFEELSKMDLFILPSKSEGLGIAIIEAMATGLPVIASNVGGIPEVVIDGMTGFLIPKKDPALLAGAVINLISNPEKGRAMGEKGRERAFKVFHPKEFASNHEKLYMELFKEKCTKLRKQAT